MVGRQRLSIRPWFTVVLVPVVLIALLLQTLANPMTALMLLGGAAVGSMLGVVGLRLTRFERTPEGFFYTPNAHLGIALSLLMVARIGYRMVPLLLTGATVLTPPADFVRSPVTLLLIGVLASYFVTYAIGLLRWRHSKQAEQLPDRPNDPANLRQGSSGR